MPNLARLTATLLLSSLPLLPASADEQQCPQGWDRICIGACICSPVPVGELDALLGELGDTASQTLQQWLETTHQLAQLQRPQPVPLHIRASLAPYFDTVTLEQARFIIGDTEAFSPASAILANPHVNAVTLLDTIVFRRAKDAEDNLTLWAHELKHVQQYLQLGSEEFARRYIQDADSIETPAYELEKQVEHDLKYPDQPLPEPQRTPQHVPGSI